MESFRTENHKQKQLI